MKKIAYLFAGFVLIAAACANAASKKPKVQISVLSGQYKCGDSYFDDSETFNTSVNNLKLTIGKTGKISGSATVVVEDIACSEAQYEAEFDDYEFEDDIDTEESDPCITERTVNFSTQLRTTRLVRGTTISSLKVKIDRTTRAIISLRLYSNVLGRIRYNEMDGEISLGSGSGAPANILNCSSKSRLK